MIPPPHPKLANIPMTAIGNRYGRSRDIHFLGAVLGFAQDRMDALRITANGLVKMIGKFLQSLYR